MAAGVVLAHESSVVQMHQVVELDRVVWLALTAAD